MRQAIVGVGLADCLYHQQTKTETDVHAVVTYYVQNQEILE